MITRELAEIDKRVLWHPREVALDGPSHWARAPNSSKTSNPSECSSPGDNSAAPDAPKRPDGRELCDCCAPEETAAGAARGARSSLHQAVTFTGTAVTALSAGLASRALTIVATAWNVTFPSAASCSEKV